MKKTIFTPLAAIPALAPEIFNLLSTAGATHFALFGGAVRDADYAARHGDGRRINDYDLRVWLANEKAEKAFVEALRLLSGVDIVETPSAGTGRIRYCLTYMGADLDISLRPIPPQWQGKVIPPEAVAQERAADADIGLCSVALDPLLRGWATPEYDIDRREKKLTVYPGSDQARLDAYAARMKNKFPEHEIIWLKNTNSPPGHKIPKP